MIVRLSEHSLNALSGMFVMVFYLVEAAVLLIAMIQIYRKVVKTIDFEELRKTW